MFNFQVSAKMMKKTHTNIDWSFWNKKVHNLNHDQKNSQMQILSNAVKFENGKVPERSVFAIRSRI